MVSVKRDFNLEIGASFGNMTFFFLMQQKLLKDTPSLTVDLDRPRTSKEFDPLPVRVADISPLPSLHYETRSTSSRSGTGQVITISPYKLNAEASKKEKETAQQQS
jgi:hypothetical protein